MFARFDENPAMTLRVIKETKRYGRTDVKTVYPLQTKFAGGIIKKVGRPGFEPTIYVSGAFLANHTTTVESTTSLSYQRISSQLYQDVYFRYCSKPTVCTRSTTKNYIFSVNTVLIYSCIKVRIRLLL